MSEDWIKSELLTERGIEEFNNDDLSEQEYYKKTKPYMNTSAFAFLLYVIIFLLFGIATLASILFRVDIIDLEFIGVSLVVLLVVITVSEGYRKSVPATCYTCKNVMFRYEYTDESSLNNLNGKVYVCHNCNTKFISSPPRMSF